MKKMLAAVAAAALMTAAGNAAVTITSSVQSDANAYTASGTTTSGQVLFNFDNSSVLLGTSNGFTFNNNNFNLFGATVTAGSANIVTGNQSNSSTPAGDSSAYLAVYNGGYETISNTTQSFNTLSLYWGTPDSFNTIDLLNSTGGSIATISASDISGLTALGSTAGLVTLTADQAFYGVKFSSSGNSFELDNVKFSTATSAVPEPATWGMMILGFGVVGFALRRRTTPFGHAAGNR